MNYRMLLDSILRNRAAVYSAQERLSSGARINRPSDDPTDYERVSRLRGSLSAVERHTAALSQAESALGRMDSVLQDMVEIFQRASEIAIEASGGSLTAADLAALGEEVDSLVTGLVSLSNSTHMGYALFDGLRGGREAYSAVDADGDGRIDSVTYLGSGGTRQIEVDKGVMVPVSLPGSESGADQAVFETGSLSLFDTLIEFRDRLLNGEEIGASDTLDGLEQSQEHVLSVLGVVGGRAEALSLAAQTLSRQEDDLMGTIEQLESADLAEVAIELAGKQQAYMAALQATSGLSQYTLLNWLS